MWPQRCSSAVMTARTVSSPPPATGIRDVLLVDRFHEPCGGGGAGPVRGRTRGHSHEERRRKGRQALSGCGPRRREQAGRMSAKLIVYPPDEQGWRRVRYDGVAIGVAHRPADIRVFLAAAGLENAEDVDLTDPDFVEWRGAGSEVWDPSP